MNIEKEVLQAESRIAGYVRETPVEISPYLSRIGDCRVFLKLENYQVTGSFKIRGVMNKMLSIAPQDRRGGVIAASSGNHGAALAYAAERLSCESLIVVPENASPVKLEAIRDHGAKIHEHGHDSVLAEIEARAEAERRGVPYISPYNDERVVGGQGTIGRELERQLDEIDVIYIAVGGGGLLSGVAGFLKARRPRLEVVGCWPENSPVLYESLRAGRVVEMECSPTLSDGTAGGMEENAITFEICRRVIDRSVLVSEEEIAAAMRLQLERHHMLVEGAAAVPVAAFLRDRDRLAGKNVVLVLCGANVSIEVLNQVLR